MKQPVRLFSIGVFATSIILLVFYFFEDSKAKSNEMNTDEMITAIEEDGYRVITESEYISLSVNDKKEIKDNKESTEKQEKDANTDQKEDATSEKEKENEKEEETPAENEAVKKYTLKIESGMASSTISSRLAENGIIKDANEFTQYLEDEGYSTKIQLGEFELTSSMSSFEIAEELTK
ncbi:endolytic transglycosylase MltG [Virgibacillus ndiopensis]|uniref:endolytic transglycosylase MltG n=1 Tax=Virgibacillus ndiopensis TaxID=2004408 RepID=UPI000C06D64C|nr:endolytic transglycosylase MltG [Virgibacillus ndiopensis]